MTTCVAPSCQPNLHPSPAISTVAPKQPQQLKAPINAGEVQFVVVGVLVQLATIVLESVRLIMAQLLLQQQGIRMNPLTALYYIAPCCFACLVPLAYALELERFRSLPEPAPSLHLLANSFAAFSAPLCPALPAAAYGAATPELLKPICMCDSRTVHLRQGTQP